MVFVGFCEDLSCCFVLLVVEDEEIHGHGFFHILHALQEKSELETEIRDGHLSVSK